jgi:Flp pilus assembly protein TadD
VPPTNERGRRHRRETTRTEQRADRHRSRSATDDAAHSPAGAAWIALALVAFTVAAYAPVRHFAFVSLDDQVYVTNNPHVRAGLTWAGIIWAFTGSYAANWHPLTWISHMLDVQVFGLSAGGPHIVNLVLHTINVLLLWLVCRRLTGSVFRSAIVAALFGLHPLHVESVAWVAERKDVLSTCFALLTMWAYTGYVRRPGAVRYAGAWFLFALALMAKPMFVTLPFVLLLLDVWPLGRIAGFAPPGPGQPTLTWWHIVREKIPFFVLTILSSAVTAVAQQRGGAISSLDVVPFAVRIANTLTAYAVYLWQTVWPANLAVLYPYQTSPSIIMAVAAFVMLAGITVVILRRSRSQPYLTVGWFWFLGTLVPVIGLVQIGGAAHADRYTYFPIIGLFIAAVWGGAELAQRLSIPKPALIGAATALVIACAIATRVQTGYWADGITLWERAVAVTPENSRAHNNLGTSYADANRQADAAAEYRRAIQIQPDMPQAHNNLGLALVRLGQPDEAMAQFREAVRLKPDYVDARNGLGILLVDRGDADEAIVHLTEAVRRRPAEAQLHYNLATAFAALDRMDVATREFLEAVRLEPNQAEWQYAVGTAYAAQGDTARAIAYLEAALRLDPRHERARRALADIRTPSANGRGR